ncbi:diaminopimelate epimerase [Bacillus cereus]|uniref:Diaminopimelate epimerase n=1 Tax=Bacillus cereus TaxID=1396 RepID=A0AAW7NC61_BACCE|nr:diaminopimelate epimerase [Bacillus cereus]MDN4871840.1 diaminopimelate epimerase [Bacillus cereus]
MVQEIEFIKFNPTQNMTILVKTNHPVIEHKRIATKIMSYDNVYAEQVGFIEESKRQEADAHLKMAGGEFCGNACMALAAFITSKKAPQHNNLTEILLEVSGTDELIVCQVRRELEGYYCQIAMPIPKKIEQKTIKHEGNDLDIVMVNYHDSIHIVIAVEAISEAMRKKAQTLAKSMALTLDTKLIGILLYKSNSNELEPLIYVPHLNSIIWERGCGSGTASLGAYLAWKNQEEVVAHVKQPGGTITVFAKFHKEEVASLKIEGGVGIVAQGKAFITV